MQRLAPLLASHSHACDPSDPVQRRGANPNPVDGPLCAAAKLHNHNHKAAAKAIGLPPVNDARTCTHFAVAVGDDDESVVRVLPFSLRVFCVQSVGSSFPPTKLKQRKYSILLHCIATLVIVGRT